MKIEISDENMLIALRAYIKDRETCLNQEIDFEGTERLYKSFLEPMMGKTHLKKGTSPRTKMSSTEIQEYAGNLFALSMYGKSYKVNNWIYEPNIDKKTPDFIINDESEIIEIYSPTLKELLPNLKNLVSNVQEKTDTYKSYAQLKIIVHIISAQFIKDIINALKEVTLSNEGHSLFLYHGEKEYSLTIPR